jgi:hypothetical protein
MIIKDRLAFILDGGHHPNYEISEETENENAKQRWFS